MTCFTVKNEAGENDPRFVSLVKIYQGDENQALRHYVREYVLSDKSTMFQTLTGVYADANDFLNGTFQVSDKFTEMDANNIRANKESMYERKFIDGKFMGQMVNAQGKMVQFELKDLDKEIETLISEKKSFSENILSKTRESFSSKDISDKASFATSLSKMFASLNPDVIYSLIRGLNTDQIVDYSSLSSKPYYIKALEKENIMIHEHEVNGKKEYTIILPTTDRGGKGFNNSEIYSFMRRVFGDYKIAQKKGFSIKDSIEGRKHLMGSMVALAIKSADPDATIRGLRFASLVGKGKTHDLDLTEGIRNVKALVSNQETKRLLPKDLLDMIEDGSSIEQTDINPVYTDLLFRHLEDRRKSNKVYSARLLGALSDSDVEIKLKAIDDRINLLVGKHSEPGSDGLRPYERFETEMGKEMILLSKAKEQLMQHSGLDRSVYNTDNMLGRFDKWRKSLGDMQNAQLNMLFQQYKSIIFGVKQRFMAFVEEKNVSVKEFMKAYEEDRGISVKSRLLNYTQDAYQNLYQNIQVRTLKDGKLSDTKIDVRIIKFKDPNDRTNDLKEYERKFINESIAFHKKSLIRFIDKKIVSGEIKGYDTAEDWYKTEFKSHELNMPVMRKNSSNHIAEGSVKEAFTSMSQEATDFLELTPGDLERERGSRPYGSATSLMGDIHGSIGRLKGLGLERHNGELVLVNPNLNKAANFDVEQILHSSVYQNFKFEFEPQLIATHSAARIILLQDQIHNNRSRENEIETLDALFGNLLYNERESIAQGDVNPQKHLDWIRKVSGTTTLMFHWKSAFLATAGNMVTFTTNALSARFGDHFFNGKDYLNAVKFSIKNPKMFGDIIDKFLFHDKNESALVFSDKYKEGEKGFITGRHMMMMHTLGDRYTRGLVLMSQLQHEGLLENFEYNDGKLEYNWSKDTRNEKIKAQIQERNDKQEKLDLPYDDHQINTLTAIAAKMFGAYTDEDKTKIQTNALAQWGAQFKGYLIARANEFYQTGFENTNISWYTTDENGDVKATSYYQEGILNTAILFYKEVKRLDKSPIKAFQELRPEQKQNLKKFMADMAFFGSLFLVYGLVFGDDDEDEEGLGKKLRKSNVYTYMKFAWLDVVGIYNINDYFDLVSPASITFMRRYAEAFFDFATFNFQDGLDKSWKATGIAKSADDVISAIEKITD